MKRKYHHVKRIFQRSESDRDQLAQKVSSLVFDRSLMSAEINDLKRQQKSAVHDRDLLVTQLSGLLTGSRTKTPPSTAVSTARSVQAPLRQSQRQASIKLRAAISESDLADRPNIRRARTSPGSTRMTPAIPPTFQSFRTNLRSQQVGRPDTKSSQSSKVNNRSRQADLPATKKSLSSKAAIRSRPVDHPNFDWLDRDDDDYPSDHSGDSILTALSSSRSASQRSHNTPISSDQPQPTISSIVIDTPSPVVSPTRNFLRLSMVALFGKASSDSDGEISMDSDTCTPCNT